MMIDCPLCVGFGYFIDAETSKHTTCPDCHGSGLALEVKPTFAL